MGVGKRIEGILEVLPTCREIAPWPDAPGYEVHLPCILVIRDAEANDGKVRLRYISAFW